LIAPHDAPAAERLAEAIRAFAQRALSNRRLGYAMVLEPTEIEVEEERLHFHARFIELFATLLEAGRAAGEFDVPDATVAGACIFGALIESLLAPLAPSASLPDPARGAHGSIPYTNGLTTPAPS
jgi:hypothetical protein